MEVAPHNRNKKIILNNQWLPWLRGDVITKCEISQLLCKDEILTHYSAPKLKEKIIEIFSQNNPPPFPLHTNRVNHLTP